MANKRTGAQTVQLSKFATNLYRARVAAGLSQSDLAREVWGQTTDSRGYKVARNRDRISAYESAKAVPEPQNLNAIAKALKTTVEELAPDLLAERIDQGQPSISMQAVQGRTDLVHLQVNTLTSLQIASRVIAMLSEEGAAQPVGAVS